MKKSYIVDSTCNDMRIDRWIRFKFGKIPQGLIEKYLRSGKIKLNKKKIKSSQKISTKDNIDLFNIGFKDTIVQKSEGEMLRTPNFGRKSLNEIKEVLTGMSLYLGMEIPNWPPDNIAEMSKKLEEAI